MSKTFPPNMERIDDLLSRAAKIVNKRRHDDKFGLIVTQIYCPKAAKFIKVHRDRITRIQFTEGVFSINPNNGFKVDFLFDVDNGHTAIDISYLMARRDGSHVTTQTTRISM